MPKPKKIKSAYEIAIEREFEDSENEIEAPNSFFAENSPSRFFGASKKAPKQKNSDAQKEKPVSKSPKIKILKGESKMNVYMPCDFILSNKLTDLIDSNSVVSISMGPFSKNKANGFIRFELRKGASVDGVENLNTSILLKANDVMEDVPEINENSRPVQAFGAKGAPLGKTAIVDPKSHPGVTRSQKFASKSVVTPQEKNKAMAAVNERRNKSVGSPVVSSYEDLVKACNEVPNIDASPLPNKTPKNGMRFTRAEAIEYEKELMGLPRLGEGIYIKNNGGGRIEISDISINGTNIILAPFEVFDLSRVSARIVRDSRSLRSLLTSKTPLVSFSTREEYSQWVNEDAAPALEVNQYKAFGSAEEAMDNIYEGDQSSSEVKSRRDAVISDEEAMEITPEELDRPAVYESEETTNILRQMPKERPVGFKPVSTQQEKKGTGSGKTIKRM